jgi:hypothetical protein
MADSPCDILELTIPLAMRHPCDGSSVSAFKRAFHNRRSPRPERF